MLLARADEVIEEHRFLLQRECPLLALSGHFPSRRAMSAFGGKRTYVASLLPNRREDAIPAAYTCAAVCYRCHFAIAS